MMLTQERLRELLECNPDTGLFTWRVSRGRIKAGNVAGSRREDGYVIIRIDDKPYLAHRLMWLHVHGTFPPDDKVIDHKNRITGDNRIDNLHVRTHRQNMGNMRNSNEVVGVGRYVNRIGAVYWRCHYRINGKNHELNFAVRDLGESGARAMAILGRKALENEHRAGTI